MKKIPQELYLLLILLGLTMALGTKKNLIFTGLIIVIYLLIILIKKLINKNKYQIRIPSDNINNTRIISIILSIVLAIISFVVNKSSLSTIENIYESLSFMIISLILTTPINPSISSKTDDDYFTNSCLKTIITEHIPTTEELNVASSMGLNFIVLNKSSLSKEIAPKFIEIDKQEIDYKLKKENLHLKKYPKEILKKITSTRNSIYSKKTIKEDIIKIIGSRSIIDNLVRTIRLNMIITFSLLLLLIICPLFSFPIIFNKNILLTIFIFLNIANNFLIPYHNQDHDILKRQPRLTQNKIFNIEEIVISFLEIAAIVLAVSVFYMSTLAAGAAVNYSASICLNIYLYSILFLVLVQLTESLTILNVFKIFKNIHLLIFIMLTVLYSIIIWRIPLLETRVIGLMNYRSTIFIACFCTIWFDITKIARAIKFRKKNANVKNN